jgi:hypothetical protein
MNRFLFSALVGSFFSLLLVGRSDACKWRHRTCHHNQTTCTLCDTANLSTEKTTTKRLPNLISPKGRSYLVIDTGERGEFFEPKLPESPFGTTSPDDFAGNDRKAAKTSVANAPMETFPTVKALLDTLKSDDDMRKLRPPISKDESSDRIAQEERNVSVLGYIYAVKSEDDNDFHVILGMSPDANEKAFLNVEVSGLPQGGANRAKLKLPREAFKSFFQDQHTQFGSSYKKFDPPISVRIEGSLFFDVDHLAGVVGPTGMRPKTAWEIHPVTKIEFEIDP